jgi:hypothetical protein
MLFKKNMMKYLIRLLLRNLKVAVDVAAEAIVIAGGKCFDLLYCSLAPWAKDFVVIVLPLPLRERVGVRGTKRRGLG